MNEETSIPEEKAEVKIVVDRGSLQAIENAMELLKELKPNLPELSKEKMEEAIELIAQAKEKILPEIPPFKEVVDILGEREMQVKVKFCNLTVDGEANVIVTPLRRMQ